MSVRSRDQISAIDLRSIGGMQIAHKLRSTDRISTSKLEISSMEIDPEIDPELFKKPAAPPGNPYANSADRGPSCGAATSSNARGH